MAAFAIVLFFLLKKKNRRNRNRIISLSLHMIIIVLAAFLMAGMTFVHTDYNLSTEVVIVLDMSDSMPATDTDLESKINRVLQQSLQHSNSEHNIGVVVVGRDANIAVEMTRNHGAIISRFRTFLSEGGRPDSRAANLEAGLLLAADMFSRPDEGRIIVFSDGVQTDGIALRAVEQIATLGIRVDAVHVPHESHLDAQEVSITNIGVPTGAVQPNAGFIPIPVYLYSRTYSVAHLTLTSNTGFYYRRQITIRPGVNRQVFSYNPQSVGVTSFRAEVVSPGDTWSQNNIRYSFFSVGASYSILMLEGAPNEALQMQLLLQDSYDVTVLPLSQAPTTIDELLQFDQIMLFNASPDTNSADILPRYRMPVGFEANLEIFVRDHGGGLLTGGGANAYRTEDFAGDETRPLGRLLPILPAAAAPPMAVTVVIDITTSMFRPDSNSSAFIASSVGGAGGYGAWQGAVVPYMISPRVGACPDTELVPNHLWGTGGNAAIRAGIQMTGQPTRLDLALYGAIEVARALDDRDLMSVVLFNSGQTVHVPWTPLTRRDEIIHNIMQPITLNSGSHTMAGISHAANLFNQPLIDSIEARHMIVIGADNAGPVWGMNNFALRYTYNQQRGISFSFIGMNPTGAAQTLFTSAATATNGTTNFVTSDIQHLLPYIMRNEVYIRSAQWENVDIPPFRPHRGTNATLAFNNIPTGTLMPILSGYFGVQIKNDPAVNVILRRQFVPGEITDPNDSAYGRIGSDPIYVQWEFGRGTVGTFTADLAGRMTSDFFIDPVGRQFFRNIVASVMPNEPHRTDDINITITPSNMAATATVDLSQRSLQANESVRVILARFCHQTNRMLTGQGYSQVLVEGHTEDLLRVNFDRETPGIYAIIVNIMQGAQVVATHTAFSAFSFSSIYDRFWNMTDKATVMADLAIAGNEGAFFARYDLIGSLPEYALFGGESESSSRTFDPRVLFLALCIGLFILDIVARKFSLRLKKKDKSSAPTPQYA